MIKQTYNILGASTARLAGQQNRQQIPLAGSYSLIGVYVHRSWMCHQSETVGYTRANCWIQWRLHCSLVCLNWRMAFYKVYSCVLIITVFNNWFQTLILLLQIHNVSTAILCKLHYRGHNSSYQIAIHKNNQSIESTEGELPWKLGKCETNQVVLW